LGQADATKERRKTMLQDSAYPKTTKCQRNHAPAALLRLGALAQRLTNLDVLTQLVYYRDLYVRWSEPQKVDRHEFNYPLYMPDFHNNRSYCFY
jgi:hypothetical protein